MNKIMITGNVTADPETFAPQNSEYTKISFSIANHDERVSGDNGYEDRASFFDVEYWTKNPQHWLQKIIKGAPVTIQGVLRQDRWEKDGQKGSRVGIKATCGMGEGFPVEVHDRAPKQETQPQQNTGYTPGF